MATHHTDLERAKSNKPKRSMFVTLLILFIWVVQAACMNPLAPAQTPSPVPPTETMTPSATPTITSTPSITPIPTTNGEIKIAILVPLSGSIPSFGEMARDGALLAFDEWNARGGVLGKEIVPVIEDTQCGAVLATNAATKVIDQDNVHYIIGDVCSKASIPISEVANAAKVIQISPGATNPNLTVDADGVTKKYIYRACVIDSFQGKAGATFAYKELGAGTAYVMVDPENAYVQGLADAFKATFTKLGGKIVGEIAYSYSDNDFSTALAEIATSHPDVVYLPDYYDVVNTVTKQAKDKGIDIPFMGGDGWDSTGLDLSAAAGGYFTEHYAPGDSRSIAVDFVSAFKEKYGKDPDLLAAMGYDTANLLLQAIATAQADDTDLVATALDQIKFEGVSGVLTFDDQHNPIKSVTILKVTESGVQFKTLINP